MGLGVGAHVGLWIKINVGAHVGLWIKINAGKPIPDPVGPTIGTGTV